ncbi:MAG: hypothetical protein U1F98_00655 [Verrucomicrobiota bacterium]
MKIPAFVLAFWLALTAAATAQVSVEVVLDQEHFLPGETMNVAVRIINRSGQTLQLGADPDWLTFAVESKDGYVILKNGDVPVVQPFTLESSKRATKHVDLAPYFNLTKEGAYTVSATVNIKEWNRQFTSQARMFEIIRAASLRDIEVGVPRPAGSTNSEPQLRKYSLLQANYLRKTLVLYVQITDGAGKLKRVFPIGPMISFGQPEPQIDKDSNLHILYQSGPRLFRYFIITPDGEVIGRQTYEFTNRPRLKVGENSQISVEGGRRRITDEDIPSPDAADAAGTNSPALPATNAAPASAPPPAPAVK